MDLGLYGRVLWRFKFIVLTGIVLGAFLAVLSQAKITGHGLRYRKPVLWGSTSTLQLTQRGFPEGRALFPPAVQGKAYPYADTGRFAGLTDLYSQFANSDDVRRLMIREGASRDESLAAAPILPRNPSAPLPVIALTGTGSSPSHALAAVERGRKAFLEFVAAQQRSAQIPEGQRIDIRVLQQATSPVVLTPRKKTLPIVVFLAVLSAAIALSLVLENLRPRVPRLSPIAADDRKSSEAAETRRSA